MTSKLTGEERDLLKQLVNQARRARIKAEKPRGGEPDPRADYYRTYHERNREKRLARMRERRAAAKAAA